MSNQLKEKLEKWRNRPPIKRLCIVQESGFQLGPPNGRYETHILEFVPFDDLEFGKARCAELNEKTDLPFYLTEVEVKITGEMKEYTLEDLKKEGIEPLEKFNWKAPPEE